MQLRNLVLEVTRRCNMKCAHCLRGKQGNHNLQEDVVRAIARKYSIDCIVPTGGEPFLSPSRLVWISDYIHYEDIYIVTNGSVWNKTIADVLRRLYWAKGGDITGLSISNDSFHDNAKYRYDIEEFCEIEDIPFNLKTCDRAAVRNMGNAIYTGVGRNHVELSPIDIDEDLIDSNFYVTYKGDIYGDCDLSYEVMKHNPHLCLGNVFMSTSEILDNINNYNEKELYKIIDL